VTATFVFQGLEPHHYRDSNAHGCTRTRKLRALIFKGTEAVFSDFVDAVLVIAWDLATAFFFIYLPGIVREFREAIGVSNSVVALCPRFSAFF
jgi:hypothetical protein